VEIIREAVQRFRANDFLSCNALLWTRIEGILRSHARLSGQNIDLRPGALARHATKGLPESALVMPRRFERYITSVYFRKYDPQASPDSIGRHSVSHGDAPVAFFDKKHATIALLIVHQLAYVLG
jgi:hypothetical protein